MILRVTFLHTSRAWGLCLQGTGGQGMCASSSSLDVIEWLSIFITRRHRMAVHVRSVSFCSTRSAKAAITPRLPSDFRSIKASILKWFQAHRRAARITHCNFHSESPSNTLPRLLYLIFNFTWFYVYFYINFFPNHVRISCRQSCSLALKYFSMSFLRTRTFSNESTE